MKLSVDLHNDIVEFLLSIPNIQDNTSRRAFVYSAGLDTQLQNQIDFAGSSGQFFQLFVSTLVSYGRLEDGRDALEAVLKAAKEYVGTDRQTYCESLIQKWRTLRLHDDTQENPDALDVHRKTQISKSLDSSILQTLYTYYQKHPGDPEMSVEELLQNIPKHQVDAVQTELFALKRKGWIGYELTISGTAGLVWIEPKGLKIAKQLT